MSFDLSLLDLVPISATGTAQDALHNMVKLAQTAERLGYKRFWLAEHHGMPSIASSSPEVLIGHVAAATERIRVGAGGIMLPNHAPLRIAEAFHTLAALHPNRIDLGIGRAPGTDPKTSAALRPFDASQFPAQMYELFGLSRGTLPADHPFYGVRVVPEDVQLPPVWLLGSSGASAQFAGQLGVGYGFAAHFSPTPPKPALDAYRAAFTPQPDTGFEKPHVLLAVTVICAPTDEEADYLAKSMDLMWVRMQQGRHERLPSPEEAMAYTYSERERAVVEQYRSLAVVGAPNTVRRRLEAMAAAAGADELMVSSIVYGAEERLRSFRLLGEAFA